MMVRKEYDFDIRTDCWGGAKDRIDSLTSELVDRLEGILDDEAIWGEEMPTETEVNDLIWFDDDNYADWLGFDGASQLWDYCTLVVDRGIDEDEIWKDPDGEVITYDDLVERYNDALANEEFDDGDYDGPEDWADYEGYEKFDI